ncbi:cyclic nucleotide-binding domain-containing protein [Psittacicella hinzii]|uniref:cyclic nucleotide-binding domain-containing protein n=1 Tax=Psittacicella hinzii TaxID=2028575 RepID=UPI001CA67408|nr:cyclic nucleotide-binding domain-containing protein [Psittacicella hinzii]
MAIRTRKDITIDDVGGNASLLQFCRQGRIIHGVNRQVLFESGDLADRIFLLIHGSIQVFTNNDEHELVLSYLTGLNFFGEMGYVGQETRRSASIRCRTECTIVEMEYKEFDKFIMSYPQTLKVLCEHLARRLKHTTQQISSMAFDDVHDRVIETIFHLAQIPDAISHPHGIQIRTTRQEIGNMLGCSRETVGRVIKSMEDKGLLYSKGKTIILNYPRSFHEDQPNFQPEWSPRRANNNLPKKTRIAGIEHLYSAYADDDY